MKYYNKLQKEIVEYLHRDPIFYSHGRTSTHFFKTWTKEKEKFQITALKPHGYKDNISAEIRVYENSLYPENDKLGIEFKIDMYMWGYQSQETVFQGWAESLEEFKLILKAVGL
jgi:hypothetical protein